MLSILFVNYFLRKPAVIRDKPGNGFGLRLPTDFGTLRLGLGLNARGGSVVHFNIGERF